jgi:hypothetical protein
MSMHGLDYCVCFALLCFFVSRPSQGCFYGGACQIWEDALLGLGAFPDASCHQGLLLTSANRGF